MCIDSCTKCVFRDLKVVKPLNVELPRSMVLVVTSWNIPCLAGSTYVSIITTQFIINRLEVDRFTFQRRYMSLEDPQKQYNESDDFYLCMYVCDNDNYNNTE